MKPNQIIRAGFPVLAFASSVFAVTPASVVVKAGDTFNFPGPVTRTVSTLNAPFTNSLGKVGFVAAFSDSTRGIWYDTGFTFVSPAGVTGGESTMGISDTGGFIYSPAVGGNDAVYTQGGPLLTQTDPIPNLPGRFSTFNSRPTMLPSGASFWIGGSAATAGGSTSNRHLFKASDPTNPLTIAPILSGGDIIEGKPISLTASNFDYDFSDNGNHHLHVLDMVTGSSTNNIHLYRDGTFVAQESLPVGDGTNWSSFDTPSINNAGNYVFSGVTSGGPTTSDSFLAYNNSIKIREGDTIDGVTLATGAAIRAASINNLDQAVYIWGWGTGSSLREHLFFAASAASANVATRLLSLGDIIDVDNDSIGDFTITDFEASPVIGPGLELAEDGRVYVEVSMIPVGGTTEVEAIIGLAVPEPATACLLALAAVGAIRRRR